MPALSPNWAFETEILKINWGIKNDQHALKVHRLVFFSYTVSITCSVAEGGSNKQENLTHGHFKQWWWKSYFLNLGNIGHEVIYAGRQRWHLDGDDAGVKLYQQTCSLQGTKITAHSPSPTIAPYPPFVVHCTEVEYYAVQQAHQCIRAEECKSQTIIG